VEQSPAPMRSPFPSRPTAVRVQIRNSDVMSRGLQEQDSGVRDQGSAPTEPRRRGHCIHKKQRSRCRLCGGGSICIHGKLRPRCQVCGGNAFCIHRVYKYTCKECGKFCPHGRAKPMCKDCGGSAYCRHGKRRVRCWECGGASLCVHRRQKHLCKECGGSSICVHGRVGSQCKECGGATICSHGKVRPFCKYCAKLCEHGKFPRLCVECGGSSLCSHSRNKWSCSQCQATRLCTHGRVKRECEECSRKLLKRRRPGEPAATSQEAAVSEASGPDPWELIDQLSPEARMQIHHAIMLAPFTTAWMQVDSRSFSELHDGARALVSGTQVLQASGTSNRAVGFVILQILPFSCAQQW
jgi:hypothetical protein